MLVLLIGPSGAGKSHYVETHCYTEDVISSDEIRTFLCGDFKDQSQNKLVFQILHFCVLHNLPRQYRIVVDATNLKAKDRKAITALAGPDEKIHYIVLDRPLEDKLRDGGWRLYVKKGDKSLIEYHHDVFQNNLKNILEGDGDNRVTVFDLRKL